jgi:hypothetical protein
LGYSPTKLLILSFLTLKQLPTDYIKLPKGGKSLLFNIVVNTPKGALYVGKFSRKGGDEVVGGATSKASTYNIKKST